MTPEPQTPSTSAPATRRVVVCVLALAFALSLLRYGYDGVFRALVGPQHDFAVYYAAGKAIRFDDVVACKVEKYQGPINRRWGLTATKKKAKRGRK